jgi:7,8-dihydro-6-hydroxymethylpterin-pyrophosphokinase
VREERWGDRTLDLDIVTFADIERETDELVLPHPRAWQRPFVIRPWLEVEPDAVLPGYGRIAELAAATSDDVWPFAAPPLLGRLEA